MLLLGLKQTIWGTPEYMKKPIFIVPRELLQNKDKKYFEEDDLLKLQCIGEEESINGTPSKVHVLNTCFT